VAFFTSFEAITSYAKTSGGIAAEHAWAIPLLVDSFIVVATGADLWLSVQQAQRAWWEVAWPKVLLGGAAGVSFVLNVAHAQAGDWPARGVAAIPPAALVLSVELLVMIVRRAAIARTTRLAIPTSVGAAVTEVARGDQQATMPAPTGDRPALPPTTATIRPAARSHDHHPTTTGDHRPGAAGDQSATGAPRPRVTTSDQQGSGATYRRVRELYVGGMTVAAEIARELGVSASYAQRILRRVKGDLARQAVPQTSDGRTTTPEQAEEATSDHQRNQAEIAARSHDHLTSPDRHDQQPTSRTEATRDGDGRTTTTNGDRHLTLVAPDHDRGEVQR
jgi:transposase-like protein